MIEIDTARVKIVPGQDQHVISRKTKTPQTQHE